MFCKNCGAILSDKDLFCKNCGSTIGKNEVTPEVPRQAGVSSPESKAALIDSIILSKIFKSKYSLVIAIFASLALISLCCEIVHGAMLRDYVSISLIFLFVPFFICGIITVVGAWEIFASKKRKKKLTIGKFSRYRSLIVAEKVYSVFQCVYVLILAILCIGYKFENNEIPGAVNKIEEMLPKSIGASIAQNINELYAWISNFSPIFITVSFILVFAFSVINSASLGKWNQTINTLGLCTKKIPPYTKVSSWLLYAFGIVTFLTGCILVKYYVFLGVYRICLGVMMFMNAIMFSHFEQAKQDEKI